MKKIGLIFLKKSDRLASIYLSLARSASGSPLLFFFSCRYSDSSVSSFCLASLNSLIFSGFQRKNSNIELLLILKSIEYSQKRFVCSRALKKACYLDSKKLQVVIILYCFSKALKASQNQVSALGGSRFFEFFSRQVARAVSICSQIPLKKLVPSISYMVLSQIRQKITIVNFFSPTLTKVSSTLMLSISMRGDFPKFLQAYKKYPSSMNSCRRVSQLSLSLMSSVSYSMYFSSVLSVFFCELARGVARLRMRVRYSQLLSMMWASFSSLELSDSSIYIEWLSKSNYVGSIYRKKTSATEN